MSRAILAILACAVLSQAQPPSATVTGTYHFTTPQSDKGLNEAVTVITIVAAVPQVTSDAARGVLTFSGPAEGVNLAAWILPQIDKATGDNILHEYRVPSGDLVRVRFVSNPSKPQEQQELLTILRTVADVQKIFTFTSNQAFILRGPEWQVTFAAWIIDQIDQPITQNPNTTPRAFTVGGPDYRGLGHGARVNYLGSLPGQQRMQELLTVLRTVDDIFKVFSYTSNHVFVLRANDADLQRAEWLIQELASSGTPPAGSRTFTAPAGDDVTTIFNPGAASPKAIQATVAGLRSDLNIKKIFPVTTKPATIVVRGTADQIAAATAWMAAHNALAE